MLYFTILTKRKGHVGNGTVNMMGNMLNREYVSTNVRTDCMVLQFGTNNSLK